MMRVFAAALACTLLGGPAFAQDEPHQHAMTSDGWQWSAAANVFFGYNYQYRKFTDFDEVESQNWLMTSLARAIRGSSHVQFDAMISLEPFTIKDVGSHQVFQTGETFNGAPLIDYQHPHDLIMNLGGEYSTELGGTTMVFSGYLVGPAPIGPEVFMHRPSAIENPQSPLSHHHLDSTHVTPGVVSVAIERAGFSIEGGAFHGREPDEDRLDLDTAALDSWAMRAGWADGPWAFQVSGGHLKTPERTSPYDEDRWTASAQYFKGDERHSIAWTAAFGQNREVFGNLEAYLLEGTWRHGNNVLYSRAEWVEKDILDAGFHPIGVQHTHRVSPVGALTLGYTRDMVTRGWGRLGVGGDVTGYAVPANLEESYGSPLSFHIFLRYNGRFGARMLHTH